LIIDWAIMGVVVDGLYRFQAFMFGTDSSVATVAKKMAFDMFVWNPCVGVCLTI
jgi:hypothetical protein